MRVILAKSVILFSSVFLIAQTDDSRSRQIEVLERDFAAARGATLVHSLSELPPGEREFFLRLAGGEERLIAEFGEEWNPADIPSPGIPTAQHLFSILSDELIGIVYLRGGFAPTLNLFLKYRDSETACRYYIGQPSINVTMEAIRMKFVSDSTRPTCRYYGPANQ